MQEHSHGVPAAILTTLAVMLLSWRASVAEGLVGQAVAVNNAHQLYQAFRNESVSVVYITNDIDFKDSPFENSVSPVVLQRNLLLIGRGYPTLNFRFLGQRIRLEDNITVVADGIVFKRVISESTRARAVLITPQAFWMGNHSALRLNNCAVQAYACLPEGAARDYLNSLPRFGPGNQTVVPLGNGFCLPPGSSNARCWTGPQAAMAVSIYTVDPTDPLLEGPGEFFIQITNTALLCEAAPTDECIRQYGVQTCVEMTGIELVLEEDKQEAAAQALGKKDDGSDERDSLVIVLPAVLGGAFLVAVLVLLAVLRVFWRRNAPVHGEPNEQSPKAAAGAVAGAEDSMPRTRLDHSSSSSTEPVQGAIALSLEPAPSKRRTSTGTVPVTAIIEDGRTSASMKQLPSIGQVPCEHFLLEPDPPGAPNFGMQHLASPVRLSRYVSSTTLAQAPGIIAGASGQMAVSNMLESSEIGAAGWSAQSASTRPWPMRSQHSALGSVAVCSVEGPPSSSGRTLADTSLSTVITQATPLEPGIRLDLTPGDITVLPGRPLGVGSYGRVVKCMYQGQLAAAKYIHPSTVASARELACFRHEAQILARCAHPNVVRLLGACLDESQPFLVEELLPCSLKDAIYCEQPLELATALSIARDIAVGLSYLHPTILHRDLKPGNILLTGHSGTAKLSDFGLAKIKESTLVTSSIESGTAAYMAPECFAPDNYRLTPACDIYSLGVLLSEMLTREPPWKGVRPVVVGMHVSVLNGRPALPDDPERCPPRVRKLVESCWAVCPMHRPSALAVAKELTLIMGQAERRVGSPRPGSLQTVTHQPSPPPSARAGSLSQVQVHPDPHLHLQVHPDPHTHLQPLPSAPSTRSEARGSSRIPKPPTGQWPGAGRPASCINIHGGARRASLTPPSPMRRTMPPAMGAVVDVTTEELQSGSLVGS